MIKVRNLIKRFGLKPVLRGLDFDVNPGEFVGLIGPNGTGKTNVFSAIRLLKSLLVTRHPYYRRNEIPLTTTSEIKTWFDIDGKTVIHAAKLNIYTDEHNYDEIISSEEKR